MCIYEIDGDVFPGVRTGTAASFCHMSVNNLFMGLQDNISKFVDRTMLEGLMNSARYSNGMYRWASRMADKM